MQGMVFTVFEVDKFEFAARFSWKWWDHFETAVEPKNNLQNSKSEDTLDKQYGVKTRENEVSSRHTKLVDIENGRFWTETTQERKKGW